MGIKVTTKGGFARTDGYLILRKRLKYRHLLEQFGRKGVEALKDATPKESGETAESWDYKIENTARGMRLVFTNDAVEKGYFSIVIGLDEGHGTRNGGFVEGKNFIDPTIEPILSELSESVWKGVRG